MNKLNSFFKGFQQGFRNFGHAINNVVNFFLLLIVYVLGIGLVSIISKLSGKHFLDIKKENKKTNWHDHKVVKQSIEKYYRTF